MILHPITSNLCFSSQKTYRKCLYSVSTFCQISFSNQTFQSVFLSHYFPETAFISTTKGLHNDGAIVTYLLSRNLTCQQLLSELTMVSFLKPSLLLGTLMLLFPSSLACHFSLLFLPYLWILNIEFLQGSVNSVQVYIHKTFSKYIQ